jgi:hypothetical protein
MPKSSTKLSSLSTNSCSSSNIGAYVGFTWAIIFTSIIILSLSQIEKSKCDCAKIPNKDYIKEWFIIYIIVYSIIMLYFIISNEQCWNNFYNYPFMYGIILIFGIINFIMLIRTFLYVRILRNSCNCAYGSKEKFIFWYLAIVYSIIFVLIAVSFLLLLFSFLFFTFK